MFGCEGVHLEYPTKKVLDGVTLGVHEGDRIGVVGQNGEGKSSLLKLLARSIEPDEGTATRTRGLRMGVLDQTDALADASTVRESIVGGAPEYVWASDARIREVVSSLVADIPWNAQVSTLSGGQRRRVDLARLLVGDDDALLLDEPTNHLDMRAISWLAAHLARRWPRGSGALLVVTHDRWFLDEVCTRMWEVHAGRVIPFEGGYSAYMLQRVERDRVERVTEQRRQNLARKELAWLSRGARARSTKPKFHVEAAEALINDVPPMRDPLELKTLAMQRLGKQVIDLTGVSVSFGGRAVLNGVDWSVGPGDRVGILGENGAGKTTLLRVVQRLQRPDAGFVKIGKTVKFAVLSQRLDELAEQDAYRVTEVLSRYPARVVVDGKETTPAKLLERLGFSSKALFSRVGDLSGGQKRRLQLMLTLIQEPNVLILDEPGNDLDTDMLAMLEDVLDTWAGTLIMVTHDRHLMERVTDDQYALIGGKVVHCPRGVDEYLQMLEERDSSRGVSFADVIGSGFASPGAACAGSDEAASSGARPFPEAFASSEASVSSSTSGVRAFSDMPAPSGASAPSGARASLDAFASSGMAASSGAPASPRLSNAEMRELKKRLSSLQRRINTASSKVDAKRAEMSAADPTDFVLLGKLQAELDARAADKEALEDEWLEVADALGET